MQTVPRLYNEFQPHHYDIHWDLTQAEKNHIISGTVNISGEQIAEKIIRLHVHELRIKSVYTDDTPVTDYTISDKSDELIIPHHTTGSVQIKIEFELKVTKAMHGIYPSYFVHDGQRQQLIATQFESHHAREAFPCIDEPEAKATFCVSLTHPTGHVALSNMTAATSEVQGHATFTTFDTTPRMSSYLLAFVVGKMHSKTAKTSKGVDVSVWATPAQPARSLDFALETAVKVIEFYEDYFGVDYPLAKSDHVALPDFSSGAMENWGLITYREVCLLADPETSGVSGKHLVASVVAHELAHQWFGNLVTMRWWNNLWLNESFADFVEHIAVDAIYPEWETWLDFTLSRGIAALRRDAIDGVQPVQMEIHHPDEIATIFDGAIVYGKGARLMKMLRAYIGDGAFRSGLKDYFTKFAYQNTTGDDLWDCLSRASGKDVGSLMNTWITQPGYPLLRVLPNKLSQEQFFIGEHAENSKVWPILLNANPSGNTPEILSEHLLTVSTSLDQRFNSGDTSHYIADYTPEHLASLLSAIGQAPTIDRLTLLNDQTLLVRGQYKSSADLIDYLHYYATETNDAVWGVIGLVFSELRKFVEIDKDAERKLRGLSAKVAYENATRLGLDEKPGDSVSDTKLRATVISMMIYGEDELTIAEALKRFNVDDLLALPAETRPLIIGTAVRYADDTTIPDRLMKIYGSTPSAELKEDIVAGLTSTRSIDVAKSLLAACLDSEVIRPQDLAPWVIYLVRNRYTRTIAWQWLRDHWDWLKETFGGDKSYDEFPRYAAGGLASRQQLQEYIDFFTPMLDEPALTRTIKMGISEISARVKRLDSDTEAVCNKLKSL
ncbi:MAG: M1 family metallopeptidase [Candidatus Saccharimonas sp.]